MCNDNFNERLAPLNPHHLQALNNIYPEQKKFATKVYDILTRNLTPQANLLVTFVVLKQMFDEGCSGIFRNFGSILYVPLSIVAKTSQHEWTRFRPVPVMELHDSFLSFMMAKQNLVSLEGFLSEQGLALSRRHCCGILFGDIADVRLFEGSRLARYRNKMRSYAEAMGMPVSEVEFDSIPRENSDMGEAERDFYRRYQEAFSHIAPLGYEAYIELWQNNLWEEITDAMPRECHEITLQ